MARRTNPEEDQKQGQNPGEGQGQNPGAENSGAENGGTPPNPIEETGPTAGSTKAEEENAALKAKLAEYEAKNAELLEQQEQLKKKQQSEANAARIAAVSEAKPKLVKVKFIKDHTFNLGTEKVEAVKGEVLSVEFHVANLLLQRSIAFIMG